MAESSTAPPTQRPYQTKLVLLGEAAVGKSSVVLRFVSNDFQENKEPTIGAAFLTQKCRLEDRVIKFEIWDTAGQERFHSLAPMYYRNAQASAVIYDVTKASSFEKAKSWVKELQRQANPNIVIALVGNKIDLLSSSSSTSKSTTQDQQEGGDEEDEDDDGATTTGAAESSSSSSLRAVPKEEATAYAKELGLLFFETSAKTGEGVTEVFTEVAKRIKIEAQNKDLASSAGAANAGSRAGGNNANRVDINRGGNGDGRNNKEACAC